MSVFTINLQSATQFEQLSNVVAFSGSDSSGQFGIMKNHSRFITTHVFGLARVRYENNKIEYIALPGGVLYFDRNQLTVNTRRYLRGEDYTKISEVLREELAQEELQLAEFKHSIEQMERAMILRLWRIGRREVFDFEIR